MRAELHVRVTPRASRNRIQIQPDDAIRIWVTASPTDGQANGAACELVADVLGLAKGRVQVKAGHKGRDKVLSIDGLDLATCKARLVNASK